MTTSRSFTLLCTVGVFCFISYNMVRMPVLALFAESLGASPERIGLIVSVSTLTGVFLKLPSGALSDIYGRRFLLRIGVVAFGLPPFLYPWVTDLDTLTTLRFFHGLATAIFAGGVGGGGGGGGGGWWGGGGGGRGGGGGGEGGRGGGGGGGRKGGRASGREMGDKGDRKAR